LLIKGLLWGAPSPGAHDPSLLNGRTVELIGRLHADARVFDTSCSALIAVDRIDGRRFRGRTEVVLQPCLNPPQQGWQLKLTGALKAPQAGVHRLVSGPASRLHRLGSWSQLRADQWQVLHKSWTPIADARRSVAARFQQVAGPQRGGLLAALVLGGAQVQLPAELREAFRVAGLSHALAASGFHLSVVLGAVLAIARGLSRPFRVSLGCSALLMFLTLAGGQPSVVRAVLMGATALLIRESDQRSRGAGVLLFTLILMLLIRPDWAHSVGFQLSAAATAGLTLSAPGVEQQLLRCCPSRIRWLASAIAVSWAALIWTLPLQLLHFGSTPLYALVANLLAAPLLAPLTLSAMGLAVVALLLPHPLLVGLSWPVQQLAGMLISLVHWISHWPAAQLLTGHPQPWVVLLMAFGLIPWVISSQRGLRGFGVVTLLSAVFLHAVVQLGDGVVVASRFGRHWLLARHRGRAALVSTHAEPQSCRVAKQLAHSHGHRRLDWIVLLDPVASEAMGCWMSMAEHVQAPHQGHLPLLKGQRLRSEGLVLSLLTDKGQAFQLQAGEQRWRLLPNPQALWAAGRSSSARSGRWTGTWLGFKPTQDQQRWLHRLKAKDAMRVDP
jgi:competence protein ComEC